MQWRRNRKTTWAIVLGLAALVFAAGYLFLWGRLFPFSPLVIGFSRHEEDRVVVYLEPGSRFHDFEMIAQCVPGVEQAHGLAFKRKPEIFLFETPAAFHRVAGSTVRFKTFPGYGRIFVSPRAIEEAGRGIISLPIYLKHELSHSLLYQHMSLYRSLSYPRWLQEGLATHTSGMMGHAWYPDKATTYELMRQGNFFPPRDFETRRERASRLTVPNQPAFLYSEFACIIDDLTENYGREKVLAYVHGLLKESHDLQLFRAIFGRDFDAYLSDFRRRIDVGSSPNS